MSKPMNSMRMDPTRTTMLRRGLMGEMRKRFRALRAAITRLIVDEDAFGLRADRQAGSNAVLAVPVATSRTLGLATVLGNALLVANVVRRVGRLWYVYGKKGQRLSRGYPTKKQAAKRLGQIEYFKRNEGGNGTFTINTRWRFETDAAKVEGYQTWLKGQVDAGILEVSPDNLQTPWMEKYIKSSYKKGAMRAYTDTHAAGIAAAAPDFAFMEGGKAGFLKMAFDSPTAEGKMKLLSTRSFSQLKGVTAQMDQEMSRILADGISAGKGPRKLARELNKSVSGLEKKRALAIARTEIIHAHAEGQLDAFEAMNVEEVGVQAEWSTAHDDLVCPLCQPLEGVVLSVKEARGSIPRHPNCRCAWIPAGVGEHIGGTTTTKHAGPGQDLAPPGTLPTGKTTGQSWNPATVGGRIRDSIKAEFPKLGPKDARVASRWVGADLTKISQKLKPGSKAYKAAVAAAKARRAVDDGWGIVAGMSTAQEESVLIGANGKVIKGTLTKGDMGEVGADPLVHKEGAGLTSLHTHPKNVSFSVGDYITVSDQVGVDTLAIRLPNGEVHTARILGDRKLLWQRSKDIEAGIKQKYLDQFIDGKITKAQYKAAALEHQIDLSTQLAAEGLIDFKVYKSLDEFKAALRRPLQVSTKRLIGKKQAAKLAHSLDVKVGMTMEQYGLTDDMVFYPDGSPHPALLSGGAKRYATSRGVAEWGFDDWVVVAKGTEAHMAPSVPKIQAQMKALDEVIEAKLASQVAIAKAAGEAKGVAEETAEAFTQKTVVGVGKWGGTPAAGDILDHADYSHLPGWGAPTAGRSQSYGLIIFDDQGRVLMREPTGHYGGAHWTFAKGGGSKPGTTALAELAEETGHKGAIHDVIPGGFQGSSTKTNYFVGKSVGYDSALMDAETAATKWMTFDEAKEAIAMSKSAKVVARDTGVLEAAFKTVHESSGIAYYKVVSTGQTGLQETLETAAKKAYSHKVKLGMAQKHFAKPKFGGGVVDVDWVNPATKQKLSSDGLNKVLSEKGWHTTTLSKGTVDELLQADDVVAQKAIIDTFKKVPKAKQKAGVAAKAVDDVVIAPAVTPKTIAVPLERDLTKVKDLPGSTRPYLAKDRAGKQWVVKDSSGTAIAPDHLRSEATADELYRRLGIATPGGKVVDTPSGPMKITEYLEGGETLAEWKVGKSAAQVKEMHEQIRKGFVADALLANYDVAGLANDNILIVAGKAHRIDNGGALAYRAQGGAKRTWGAKVQELESMRDASVNANTAAIYEGITDDEIHAQIRHIAAHRDDVLAAIPDDAVRATMAARIDDLTARLPAQPATAAARTAPDGTRRAAYGNTPETADRVKRSRSNGVNIVGDRGDIEDNNMLVWEEIGADGKRQTRLQFKVTQDGSDKIKNTLGDELARAQATAPTTSNVHPEDTYWATIEKGVKTINVHAGDGQYNLGTLEEVEKVKVAVQKKLKTAKGDTKKMLAHYADAIDKIEAAKVNKTPTEVMAQYVHKPKALVAVPRPRRDLRVRRDSGIDFRTVDFQDGVGKAGGGKNVFSTGEAYTVDAGDGLEIKFIPNDGSYSDASGRAMHGTVIVVVPEEASEAAINKALGMVDTLGINSAPPSAAYEEALYLHRGVYIQGKHTAASYKKIWEDVSLPDEEKVVQLKGWVRKNMGVDVDTLPYYDPIGVTRHADGTGFRHWDRWDLPPDQIAKEMKDYALIHTTGSLSNSSQGEVAKALGGILDSGGEFTSTTGRIRKGVSVGSTGGASSHSDISSGGASYFFTRIKKADSSANGFYFRIGALSRQDAISYKSDRFGRISALGDRGSTVAAYKQFASSSGNETIFKEGFGLDDIDFIRVRAGERDEVLKVFKDRGIDALPDGRPVEDVVVVGKKVPKNRRLQ